MNDRHMLLKELKAKVRDAFSYQWDPDRPTRAGVFEDGKKVGLRFEALGRSGSWVTVHEEEPVALLTQDDADDLLAQALSIFLMKHPGWRS